MYGLKRICPWCENKRVLRGESVYLEFLSPNDNRWYTTTSSPMYHGDGSISSVALIQEITARKLAEEQSIILAYYDSLTGLPNRNLFSDRLDQALNRAKRNGYLAAVMILDMDYFKTCNDTLGHAGGDFVLKAVAQRLRGVLRKDDTVVRLGGDEFAIIAAGSSRMHEVATVAQKILDLFRQPFFCQGKEVWMTTSIGIAFFPLDAEDAETLINNADEAMYAAKAAGRNNYKFFSEKLCRPLRSPVT